MEKELKKQEKTGKVVRDYKDTAEIHIDKLRKRVDEMTHDLEKQVQEQVERENAEKERIREDKQRAKEADKAKKKEERERAKEEKKAAKQEEKRNAPCPEGQYRDPETLRCKKIKVGKK